MEKMKLSERQIQEMLYGDMISIIQDSKKRLEDIQTSIEKDQTNKDLQKQYEKEYDAFIKLFSTITNPINSKEH